MSRADIELGAALGKLAAKAQAAPSPPPARDYRKECWIAAAAAVLADPHVTHVVAIQCADTVLTAFNQRFPS